MQFKPSPEAVDYAIKSQRWYGWMLSSRIDGESRNRIGIDRLQARRNISMRLSKLFMCISDALKRRGEKEMCILQFTFLDAQFRTPVRDNILKALKLSKNVESSQFSRKIANELLCWVEEGHRPDLFKIEKPNLLILARQQ